MLDTKISLLSCLYMTQCVFNDADDEAIEYDKIKAMFAIIDVKQFFEDNCPLVLDIAIAIINNDAV